MREWRRPASLPSVDVSGSPVGVLLVVHGVGLVATAVVVTAYAARSTPWTTGGEVAASVRTYWARWTATSGVGPLEGLAYAGLGLTAVGVVWAILAGVRTVTSEGLPTGDTFGQDPDLGARIQPVQNVVGGPDLDEIPVGVPSWPGSWTSARKSTSRRAGRRVTGLLEGWPSPGRLLPPSTTALWVVAGLTFGYGPLRGFLRGELVASLLQTGVLVGAVAAGRYVAGHTPASGTGPVDRPVDGIGGITGVAIGFLFTGELWALHRALGGDRALVVAGVVLVGLAVAAGDLWATLGSDPPEFVAALFGLQAAPTTEPSGPDVPETGPEVEAKTGSGPERPDDSTLTEETTDVVDRPDRANPADDDDEEPDVGLAFGPPDDETEPDWPPSDRPRPRRAVDRRDPRRPEADAHSSEDSADEGESDE